MQKNETGMVIVEATIVFPVMFLVIFLMLFAGNAYLQKCRVDSYVNQLAIAGAAYCADPMLDSIMAENIPGVNKADIRPYRYFIGGMEDTVGEINVETERKIKSLSSGLFLGMKPSHIVITTKFNNGYIYSSFSVGVDYQIEIPIRLLGEDNFITMNLSSHADMPVSDTTEFIRNVNMVEDYMQRYLTGGAGFETAGYKLTDMLSKATEWINGGVKIG